MKLKKVSLALAIALLVFDASAAEPSKLVPKLNIVWDCGACSQNEKVIPLIEQVYREEAAKKGSVISETESADVAITDYRQRNPGLRVSFGFMAGKDRLGVKIRYQDRELTANDYSANAMMGMNHLCGSVGRQVYQKLSALAGEAPPPNDATTGK